MRFTNTLTGSRPILLHHAGRYIHHPWMLRVGDVFAEAVAVACRRPAAPERQYEFQWLVGKSKPAQPYILDYTLEPWGLKTEAADMSAITIDGPAAQRPGDPCPHTTDVRRVFFDTMISRLRQMAAEIIVITDGADMVCLRNPALIVPAFQQYNCDVLYGAEILPCPSRDEGVVWRNLASREDALEPGQRFRYLNGGGCAGRRRALIEWFELVRALHLDQRAGDSQGTYRLAYTRWHPRVKLDTRCAIFQTMSSCMGDDGHDYSEWRPEEPD